MAKGVVGDDDHDHEDQEQNSFGSRMTKNSMQGFKDSILQPLMKSPTFFFLVLLLVGGFASTYLLNIPILTRSTLRPFLTTKNTSHKCHQQKTKIPKNSTQGIEIALNCTKYTQTRTCPSKTAHNSRQDPSCTSEPSTCPEYFGWIYEDLRPWSHTGISREMIEKARARSHFKLVIVNGKAYVERYDRAFQTRDLFTWWGVAQLLRRYPGKVPDLELVFNCHDWPVFFAKDYLQANATDPPTLFGFCGDGDTVDLAFPDWSYWGWPEINIKPWVSLLKDLEEGNKRMRWVDREPYAYWKGNPGYAQVRRDLMKCNPTDKQDWFKIYVEGNAWSVSQKYILACDSLTLAINPRYYDFFSRGLKPLQHYWPIKVNDKCRSIKHAVHWGNTHQKEAQNIGKAAIEFIKEELNMDNVYDYMFHLLNEYAKLLRFKPTIPQKAFELCLESMFCPANELEKKYMMDSMVKDPAGTDPCTMPPPFAPSSLFSVLEKKVDSLKQVDMLEKNYWENQNKQK
ncbi:hypothetical protein FEM48_Zijuj05G0099200 [Ziziphus jujuba var. spinosa]|uniref:Glycosyl transferase CAP10 domain-containing protein n=1 Tax=Ziziphus jujuba var. spinosa TaxID=714518 RepID=A0A978VEA4_ZIZJJ|nr:hypothetical protein FEM48_Zijuj05G0099200 [Ziziphus jujuba var. spinosa]